jgi:dihydrofolate reductase
MRKLTMYNFITLNGFYKGPGGDLSWHKHGHEESEFAASSLCSGNILLFGRVTYEMMAGYWPTPMAMENSPEVAEGMNKAGKIVFSNTLQKAAWHNSTIIKGDIVAEIRNLKQSAGNDMTILGSGSIVTQFAEAGLIDEYQIMLDPVALGEGSPIFAGIGRKLNLALTGSRTFKSGTILLSYQPLEQAV